MLKTMTTENLNVQAAKYEQNYSKFYVKYKIGITINANEKSFVFLSSEKLRRNFETTFIINNS